MNDEILIVGAGPTGLMAAILLTLNKVRVRIIDKDLEPVKTSNALALHVRTLEILKMIDVIDEFLEEGEEIEGMNLFSAGKLLAHLQFSGIKDSAYNFALGLPQSETQRLLANCLNRFNITIDRGVELDDISQVDDAVNVSLKKINSDDKEKKQYARVLACDGSHSTVREKLKMPFEGSDENSHFIMMDCKLRWDKPHNEGYVFYSETGPVAVFPTGKTHSRVIVDVIQDEALKNEKNPTQEDFSRLLKARHIPFQFEDVQWLSSFWIKTRHVENFQQGRVFYLGDSAHVHSPVGGQGMNTGIQDAYNLAWKLAMVQKSLAPESLLKSYNQERLPNAERLLKATKLATKIITTKVKWKQKLRNFVIFCINKVDFLKNKIVRQISELDIAYKSDDISISRYKDIKAGMRMPDIACHNSVGEWLYGLLNPCRYTLLYKNMDVSKFKGDHFHCLEIDKDVVFDEGSILHDLNTPLAILIRPDQYVAVVTTDQKMLDDYNQ